MFDINQIADIITCTTVKVMFSYFYDKQSVLTSFMNMSRDVRKPVFGDSDQVPHKPGWTITEDS